MTPPQAEHQARGAPSLIRIGRRVLVALGLVSVVVIGVWLWMAWQNTLQGQLQRMSVATHLLAVHAQNYFDTIAEDLEALGEELARVGALRHPAAALPRLQRFHVRHPELGGATLIGVDGQMLASTAHTSNEPLPNVLSNPQWRDDFEQNLRTRGLSVNRPQYGYLLKKWIIILRYTVWDNGRPSFLLQTSIPIERQQLLWTRLNFQRDAAVGLLRDDGYLISRIPADASGAIYARATTTGALYLATRDRSVQGTYEGVTVDGSVRIGSYHRLERYPLTVFLSYPRATYLGVWWQEVRVPLALMIASYLVGFGVYLWLARRFAARMVAIESQLRQESAPAERLPSSGVGEIDTLVEALAESQARLRAAALNRERLLLAAADAGTYEVRAADGVIVSANREFLAMLGRSENEVLGHLWSEFLAAESGPETAAPEMTRRVLQFRRPDGSPRFLSVAEYRGAAADGTARRYGMAIDVTEREQLLATVNTQSQRLQALWQLAASRETSDQEKLALMLRLALDTLGMDAVIVSLLEGEQLTVRYLADNLGLFRVGEQFALADTLCRATIEQRGSLVVPDLRADARWRAHPLCAQLGVNTYVSVPLWMGASLHGTMVFLRRAATSGGFGEDDQAFMELLASWVGLTLLELRQRAELETLALTDALTRLPNRRAAEWRFADEFARAKREGGSFAVAICDLDRFKLVNDHYGHDVGDAVLLQVARTMKEVLREGDWVARWGGEEFIVFLHNANADTAYGTMERLREAIRAQPVQTSHGPLAITTSVGVGVYRGGGEDFAQVLSEADGCLYEAKRSGRDCVVASERTRHSTLWKAGMLQHALAEQRLVPAYQVMVDLATGEVVADEALARLIEPDGKVLPAAEFIEAAEGINLIHVVDQAIARGAMARAVRRLARRQSGPDRVHFINLSPQFLARKELVHHLMHEARRHCAQHRVDFGPVKPVVLEITERQLLSNFQDLKRDLEPLLEFGFRLALDDFGSGYSSFLYLASLPISYLKIEGWMVRNLQSDLKVRSMVQSIVQLARDQGITTIAESIEDGVTADLLRDMGVNWGQGYHFGHPECESEALEQALAAVRAN